MCWAPETCPSTGKFHWQTYVHFTNARFLTSISRALGGNARVYPSHGNATQNRTYIFGPYHDTKSGKVKPANPDAKEIGSLPLQGKRNDLLACRDAILVEKKRKRDILKDDKHTIVLAKYPKYVEYAVSVADEEKAWSERDIKPEVTILWGPPGSGKTRYVKDRFSESLYIFSCGDGTKGSIWWDRYNAEETILVDDFGGQSDWSWTYLLRFLDYGPCWLQTKGGGCYRLCKRIFITSNDHPRDWYPAESHKFYALERRVDTTTHLE